MTATKRPKRVKMVEPKLAYHALWRIVEQSKTPEVQTALNSRSPDLKPNSRGPAKTTESQLNTNWLSITYDRKT